MPHRDKTLPKIKNTSGNPKHFPESKNTSQNPKHFPEFKNTSQNPKHFPEFKNTSHAESKSVLDSSWEVFCPYEPSWSKLESFLLILDHIIFRKLLKINAERGTGNEYGMKEKTKNGRKNKELETKLPVGLGFNLGFCIQVFIFPVSRACSPHPRR